jgi:hypothetical protein
VLLFTTITRATFACVGNNSLTCWISSSKMFKGHERMFVLHLMPLIIMQIVNQLYQLIHTHIAFGYLRQLIELNVSTSSTRGTFFSHAGNDKKEFVLHKIMASFMFCLFCANDEIDFHCLPNFSKFFFK